MAQTFGNTWWGKEWLRALTNIDYQNRIPRGATYARTGKVLDLEIHNSVIKARVRGSRPTPYKEVIELTPFTADDKRVLLEEILKRPALVMQLLNRNLLPEIFDIAQKHHIQIFPRQWRDLGMRCSCPDWAVPCKHLAAVIYMIGKEIDNNPFVLFQMKGLDLIKELENRGIVNKTMTQNIEVPTLESLIEKPSEDRKNQAVKADTMSEVQSSPQPKTDSDAQTQMSSASSSNNPESAVVATATPTQVPTVPVKRKRGRPRKVRPEETAQSSAESPAIINPTTVKPEIKGVEAHNPEGEIAIQSVTDTDSNGISGSETANVDSQGSDGAAMPTDHGSPETIEEIIYHKAPDFSVLQNRMEALINILPDAPSFYADGNFKDIYHDQVEKVAATVEKFFTKKNEIEVVFPTEATVNGVPERFSLDDKPTVEFNNDMNWTTKLYSMADLPFMLWSINPDFLPDYTPHVRALYTAMLTALQLARNGLVQPRIFRNSKDYYIVRWMPATHDQQVVPIMDQLQGMMPEDILTFKGSKRTEVGNSATWLVSYFLTRLYDELSSSKIDKDIFLLIFKGFRSKFDRIGYREIPGSIKSWFDFAGVITNGWLPIISVRETTMEWDHYATFALDVSLEVDLQQLQRAKEASLRRETDPTSNSGTKTSKGKKTKLTKAEKERELEAQANSEYVSSLNAATSNQSEVIDLRRIMQDPELESIRYQVLNGLSRLCTVIPEISDYINSGGERPITLKQDELPNLVMKIIPAVRMLGVKVFLPKSLRQLIRPRPSISISTKGDSDQSYLSLKDMFDYDWRVAVGDELITYAEFAKLTQGAKGLIRFKKSFIYFTESDLKKLSDAFTGKPLAQYQILQAAISGDYEGMPVQLTQAAREAVEKFRSFSEVDVPESINATLRPYQHRGFSWMFNNMQLGFGSVLADDMGLGKTLQTITLMAKLQQENALDKEMILVVAPSGLLSNWSEEIRRFAPTLKTVIYHGTTRELPKPKDVDVILTSYGMARRDKDILRKKKWRLMVIDEAQNIKNPKAQQSVAVQAIPAKCRIALSGTPVENRLSEFWSIMEYANHGYLGSLGDFNKAYSKPIQVNNDLAVAEKFKKVTGPFMMRRMKTDKSIINDLPDKVERDVMASLTPEQSALYDQTLQEAMSVIEEIPTEDSQQLFKRQGLILQMILALKQICNHPAQFLKNDDYRSDLSGKMEILLSMVESIVESNEKVLIFTQFREMGDILQNVLTKHLGREPLFYHGGVTLDKRKDMVDRFQNNRADQVMILSLKAAGTGLNLTAASHVIHYDLWWNPAVEAQATDRAYRIGQHKNVQVNRFITQGTFEQKINDIINSKRHLADMTVASGESWIGHLSNSELREIFSI